MRILLTGGTGVLGKAAQPLLAAQGHEVLAPGHAELDLFDRDAVARAVADGAMATSPRGSVARRHGRQGRMGSERPLAHRCVAAARRRRPRRGRRDTCSRRSRCSTRKASRRDETTPLGAVPEPMRSALVAEAETARFAAAGRRGVALRLGLLDGPGTGHDDPNDFYGTTLDAIDAGHALVAALGAPSGVYNVGRDGERVSNALFKDTTGWRPER